MSATKTLGPAAEAIANADAHLNDAGLMPYQRLADSHAELLAALVAVMGRVGPDQERCDPAMNRAMSAARAAITATRTAA